jgi:hypothetical protein
MTFGWIHIYIYIYTFRFGKQMNVMIVIYVFDNGIIRVGDTFVTVRCHRNGIHASIAK